MAMKRIAVLACMLQAAQCAQVRTVRKPSNSSNITDEKGTKEFLYFAPVGSDPKVMSLVKENVRNLRATFGKDQVDVFLAHYDENSTYWKTCDEAWYSSNVQFHSDAKGKRKFSLAVKLFKHFDLSPYKWVWMADEDLDAHATDLRKMVDVADASGAVINLPAFTQPVGNMSFPFQAPHTECEYRLTDIVEVIFPFFRPASLEAVLYQCDGCIGEESTWGLNSVWCTFVQNKLRLKDLACSIIDAAPVIHADFRTIPGKYAGAGITASNRSVNKDFKGVNLKQKWNVMAKHPDEFVNPRNHTEGCMGADGHYRQRRVWTDLHGSPMDDLIAPLIWSDGGSDLIR